MLLVYVEAEKEAAQEGRQKHAALQRLVADIEDLVGIVRAAEARRTVPIGGEFELQSKAAVANSLAAALDTARAAGGSYAAAAGAAAAGAVGTGAAAGAAVAAPVPVVAVAEKVGEGAAKAVPETSGGSFMICTCSTGCHYRLFEFVYICRIRKFSGNTQLIMNCPP